MMVMGADCVFGGDSFLGAAREESKGQAERAAAGNCQVVMAASSAFSGKE